MKRANRDRSVVRKAAKHKPPVKKRPAKKQPKPIDGGTALNADVDDQSMQA